MTATPCADLPSIRDTPAPDTCGDRCGDLACELPSLHEDPYHQATVHDGSLFLKRWTYAAPSPLEEYLTALLDEIGAPTEKDGESLTVQQRHANMMGRYAEIISQHRVALDNAQTSQKQLLRQIRQASQAILRGRVPEARAILSRILTLATATGAG